LELVRITVAVYYVQFTFNGSILSAFVRPTIEVDDAVLRWGDWGYRDALCEQITHSVIETNVWKEGDLELTFDTGAILRISLRAEDLKGNNPESAMFTVNLPDDKRWFVLRPGD